MTQLSCCSNLRLKYHPWNKCKILTCKVTNMGFQNICTIQKLAYKLKNKKNSMKFGPCGSTSGVQCTKLNFKKLNKTMAYFWSVF